MTYCNDTTITLYTLVLSMTYQTFNNGLKINQKQDANVKSSSMI